MPTRETCTRLGDAGVAAPGPKYARRGLMSPACLFLKRRLPSPLRCTVFGLSPQTCPPSCFPFQPRVQGPQPVWAAALPLFHTFPDWDRHLGILLGSFPTSFVDPPPPAARECQGWRQRREP